MEVVWSSVAGLRTRRAASLQYHQLFAKAHQNLFIFLTLRYSHYLRVPTGVILIVSGGAIVTR